MLKIELYNDDDIGAPQASIAIDAESEMASEQSEA